MSTPFSLKRTAGLFGVSFALMMAISVGFYFARPEGAALNIPWLSVAISLVAVLLPAVVACYWPRNGAPGALPSFKPVNGWLLAGAALCSLPFYVLFAYLQIGVGKLLQLQAETGLVEPLTASHFGGLLWIWLAVAFLPAFTEETLYRGIIQSAFVRRWGPTAGLVAAAVGFSLAHLEPAGFLSRILMGLWFGTLLLRTGSVLPGAIAHTLNNTWGVALANWGTVIEPHLPWVLAASAAALGAGILALRKAGLFERPAPEGAMVGYTVPRVVQVNRPKPAPDEHKPSS